MVIFLGFLVQIYKKLIYIIKMKLFYFVFHSINKDSELQKESENNSSFFSLSMWKFRRM